MIETIAIVLAAAMGLLVVGAAFSAVTMVRPIRNRAWTDPEAGAGLDYEPVEIAATDGVRLKGWLVPAPDRVERPAPAAVIVHGWLWNRLGTRSSNPLRDFPSGKRVELLPLAKTLHDEGYHVLMFDLRNFGESERAGVYTAGWLEARDLVGAVDHLLERDDVDPRRIGVVGFSVGGNTILHALGLTDDIAAGVAVQPASVAGFSARYNRKTFGPLGPPLAWLTERFYRLAGGPALAGLHPWDVARAARDVPVLYVQGTGDAWGGVDDVKKMVARTPAAVEPLFPETGHRFDGYNWVVQHPEVVVDFFGEHMDGVADRPDAALATEADVVVLDAAATRDRPLSAEGEPPLSPDPLSGDRSPGPGPTLRPGQ